MIRILVCDDHAVVRAGIKQILSDCPDMIIAGEAETGYEVMEKARAEDCDVIILDLGMPGLSGIEVLKQLKDLGSKVPVLFLSIYPEEHYARRLLKMGAAGYLTKKSVPEELISAVRKVASGEKYHSDRLAESLGKDISGAVIRAPHELLSDREYQVMQAIASGKTTKQIAGELSVSAQTVSTYRYRILEKMGLTGNADLVRYCVENQLV